jgi:RimJ/RimL family protein N-acetyltransferase
MNAILETSRLLLRELTLGDCARLALVLSDPASMRYYPEAFSAERVRQWILWNIDNYREYGFGLWAVILKEEGALIGDCGITLQDIEGKRLPEIGYHIIKEYGGKGYATEAASACIDFAFSKTRYEAVYSYMKADNLPSRRVAEKNGMRFVRNFEKEVYGHVVTEALYVIEKEKGKS